MIYKGKVSAGVVILEGDPPRDGTLVQVSILEDQAVQPPTLADHPAVGIWKDRTDLSQDAADAKRQLGRKLMGLADD